MGMDNYKASIPADNYGVDNYVAPGPATNRRPITFSETTADAAIVREPGVAITPLREIVNSVNINLDHAIDIASAICVELYSNRPEISDKHEVSCMNDVALEILRQSEDLWKLLAVIMERLAG